ncbi:MAG: response regulator [Magnetococcales bacterium]|nr:response regulator [Magnetococcales bacterium]MBF0113449.1 response regulator [Magnetococcales bacterium]
MSVILLVDDDEVVRTVLREILIRAGYQLLEASNGQEALKLLQNHAIDLTITDIFMPEMDGIDLLAAISRSRPGSKIIAMSGGYKAMDPKLTLRMAQSFGAVEILSKPLHAEQLLAAVSKVLG